MYIHYKRLKLYHQGKESLNSLIEESEPREKNPKELPQVPPQDTIWGMMDSEERQDHYKLNPIAPIPKGEGTPKEKFQHSDEFIEQWL